MSIQELVESEQTDAWCIQQFITFQLLCISSFARKISFPIIFSGLEIKIISREPNYIFISFIKVLCLSNSTYLGSLQNILPHRILCEIIF